VHKLLVGECQTGAKSVCKQKCFDLYMYLLKKGHTHWIIYVRCLFKLV